MNINELEIGQTVSDGVTICKVKDDCGIKYYAYLREQNEEDEQDDSVIFVNDMDEDQFL